MLALEDPRWAGLRHALGSAVATPVLLREIREDPQDRSLWNELQATLCPLGTAWSASFASIPHVVEQAAHLGPWHRLRHVAFVGNVAFGRCRESECAEPDLAQLGYQAATETAKRLVIEAACGIVWEAWEVDYLLAACAALAGRLRSIAGTA